jgi:hypothetical protein
MPAKPLADLIVRTLEQEREVTERARLKKERQIARRQRHQEECNALVASIKLDAARITNLRKYMFREDAELTAAGLTKQQQRIVRQFEEPKKSTAFGVESAAKLIEAETRGQAEKSSVKINVENATIVLPEKKDETAAPVYIDVTADDK